MRVQGSGAVDIPTHLVDQTQWLVDGAAHASDGPLRLLSVRGWSTRVPAGAFRRITAEPAFPAELAPFMDGDALDYLCNAEMSFRIGGVTARAGTRWELAAPAGGGDTSRTIARGTRANVMLEQGPETGGRRRLSVEPRGDVEPLLERSTMRSPPRRRSCPASVSSATAGGMRWSPCRPRSPPVTRRTSPSCSIELLRAIDNDRWPAALATRTLAKYALLAEAAAAVSPNPAT